VESRWEDVDPQAAGRPARRYYRITGAGVARAEAALSRARTPRLERLTPRPAPGLS
jgi:DNA-binding PadR family transcriptional regulator